jgi:hypothetical protein
VDVIYPWTGYVAVDSPDRQILVVPNHGFVLKLCKGALTDFRQESMVVHFSHTTAPILYLAVKLTDIVLMSPAYSQRGIGHILFSMRSAELNIKII